jgi:septum site-determining protein MinC
VIVWAKPIAAPQVRIAGVTARAPEGSSLSAMRAKESEMAELARLENGQIVIEVFKG